MKNNFINVFSLKREKLLRIIMRTFLFLCFTTAFSFTPSNTFSQNTRIKIDSDITISVGQIFELIRQQGRYKFVYNDDLIINAPKVKIKKGKILAKKLLKRGLSPIDCTFEFTKNETVIVHRKHGNITDILQLTTIKGTVTDKNGDPLPGTNILEKGTTNGTQADFDGNFSIDVNDGNAVLVVSYVGFATKEIPLDGETNISVIMKEDAAGLDEVVIIGYGVQKKSNLTAAVEMVKSEIIENRPVRTVSELLESSVPGLNISVTSGAVDASANINIRGFAGFGTSQQPLIMVDGVEQNINNLNSNDIESISILKDAAASAIYGSRAPYGVILITTKKGNKGMPLRINYSSTMQLNSPFKLPHTQNSVDFSHETNRGFYNDRQASGFYLEETIAQMQAFINGTGPGNFRMSERTGNPNDLAWEAHAFASSSTDYMREAFKNTSYNHTHNISVFGGSEKISYYLGLGNNNREGVYATDLDNFKRYNITVKTDTDLKDWLNLDLNIRYTKTEVERPNYQAATSGIDGASAENRTRVSDKNFWNAVSYFPNVPIKNPDGEYHWLSAFPVLAGLQGSVEQMGNELWIIPTLTLTPLKGLTVKIQYSRNLSTQENLSTTKKVIVDKGDGTFRRSARSAAFDDLTRTNSRREYYQFDTNMEYRATFGNHNVTFLLGGQQEYNQFKSIRANRRDLYSVDFPVLGNAYGDNFTLTERYYDWSTRGYYGRISYNYKSKYLIDVNARYDGSSRFHPDDRWSLFPSISVGYNIANEKFWPLKDMVNTFKLTGSWGKLGNQKIDINRNDSTNDNIDLYTYLPVFGTGQTKAVLEGGKQPFVSLPALTRLDRTWEKPETIGFGLEVGLFNNRLTAEYRWYQRTTYDAFGPAEQLPGILGAVVPAANNAISETRGWELAFGWKDKIVNIAGSPLFYDLRGTVSDYIGYVVEYGPENKAALRKNIWTAGEVFKQIYGQRFRGIAQNEANLTNWVANGNGFYYEGDVFYHDLDGDGIIGNGSGDTWFAQGDRELLGYSYPRYRYSAFLSLKWKNISLSVFLDGVGKEKKWVNNNKALGHSGGGFSGRTAYDIHGKLGYWTVDNRDAFFPRVYRGNKNVDRANDRYLIDLAHLRIKNISLTYKLPYDFLSADISFNANIENLGFIYNKSWLDLDPILIRNGVTGYPTSRVFSFGLKLGF